MRARERHGRTGGAEHRDERRRDEAADGPLEVWADERGEVDAAQHRRGRERGEHALQRVRGELGGGDGTRVRTASNSWVPEDGEPAASAFATHQRERAAAASFSNQQRVKEYEGSLSP